jgi:hypothetical protein
MMKKPQTKTPTPTTAATSRTSTLEAELTSALQAAENAAVSYRQAEEEVASRKRAVAKAEQELAGLQTRLPELDDAQAVELLMKAERRLRIARTTSEVGDPSAKMREFIAAAQAAEQAAAAWRDAQEALNNAVEALRPSAEYESLRSFLYADTAAQQELLELEATLQVQSAKLVALNLRGMLYTFGDVVEAAAGAYERSRSELWHAVRAALHTRMQETLGYSIKRSDVDVRDSPELTNISRLSFHAQLPDILTKPTPSMLRAALEQLQERVPKLCQLIHEHATLLDNPALVSETEKIA